jgi:uncharacterized Zn finger protein (UPF0148 family)
MVEPLLEAHTEWVEQDGEKRLKWTCPECGSEYFEWRRHATISCEECDRIMQAKNYDIDPKKPDPENPKEYLRKHAKSRGLPHDYYYPDDEPEAEDPLEW